MGSAGVRSSDGAGDKTKSYGHRVLAVKCVDVF